MSVIITTKKSRQNVIKIVPLDVAEIANHLAVFSMDCQYIGYQALGSDNLTTGYSGSRWK